jgi:hypothetical protein
LNLTQSQKLRVLVKDRYDTTYEKLQEIEAKYWQNASQLVIKKKVN